ncbi:undecaprenyl-diphosphate phosphatase [Oscillospiraceae bacterium CM]|nr:undecaprenyl-diphosphate phosphatase [Oscillospiraceae bacterium CM]
MSFFTAILLGLIQGVTSFLPVSTSAHQAIIHNLFHLDVPSEGIGFFNFLMNLSTLVSIFLVWRDELVSMFREGADFLRGKTETNHVGEGRLTPPLRMIYFIVIATLPLILSVPINQRADILMQNVTFVGCAMLAMGAVLFASDRFIQYGKKTEKTMDTKDALIIGLAQAFAAIPGLSRVGTSLSLSLAQGLDKDFAVRFSVWLSLPSLIIATFISFFSIFKGGMTWPSFFTYLVAFILSVLTGYLAIQTLRILTAQRRLKYFSFYLWGAGFLTVILSFIL